ncbi:hypothetical protein SPI_07226 [Niveomyces insectorum RCEF 264]|uniref:Uncharacterized protein n=1 Tax=Niveomyces insectorum RCEF 264 TaxID=1081102 RepID=A0A167QEH6_9HYPO|nr:hypothetical protein SPI_07226 [Niveomyces insectorum RCEF 264]
MPLPKVEITLLQFDEAPGYTTATLAYNDAVLGTRTDVDHDYYKPPAGRRSCVLPI